MRSWIKAKASTFGFQKVGIARLTDLTEKKHFEEWLRANFHGTMGWMAYDPERRADPRQHLPDAKTIVCLAMNYYTSPEGIPLSGRISRYAWGEDYHELLRERLEAFQQLIVQTFPGVVAKVCVDTSAVLEKVWAAKAGIGWQGKHSNVITKELGSWVFLGEIILNVELEPDAPQRDLCGRCTRCIDVCPTGAIVAPYVVDARRCIAYLTIEHRGIIPRELRSKMGNHIFGCDDCQDVCPWNTHAQVTPEAAFHPREGTLVPDLIELLSLSEEAFNARFRHSPIKRAKRSGFLRNVAIALGNSQAPEAVPALSKALEDPDPLVRTHVAWALGKINTSEARTALAQHLAIETDSTVNEEIKTALLDDVLKTVARLSPCHG
ncbi:MAG: tRNA epoxyqueuosine(34) reductase QueG [Elusimicrobia bacterium]|nr:tRNA epoxyqueuosine(34) reductase QueG [Elusimicrobiota bacterium]